MKSNKDVRITFEGVSLDNETYVLIPIKEWEMATLQSEGHYILKRIKPLGQLPQKSI